MTQKTTKKQLWGKLCLAAAAICVTASAYAAEPFPDGGTLKANTDYLLEGSSDIQATYVPDQTCTINYNCGNGVHPYSDIECSQELDRQFQSYLDYGTYSLAVEKDVPVYFKVDGFELQFGMAGMTFRISQNQPIEVVGYDNAPGSVLSVTNGFNDTGIRFNQPVTAESVTISITGTDKVANVSMSTTPNMYLYIPYVNTLNNWFNSGALRGGEDLTITVKGIKNEEGVLYKDGEDLVINYKAPEKAVRLLSYEAPNPFMSYWKQGDPDAIMTISYDGTISKAEYQMTFGNFEAEIPDGYLELGASDNPDSPAKVTIEGNIVKIDFAGFQRRPQDMVPSGTDYGNLVLKVYAYDEIGQPVMGNGSGQVGSFDQLLNYRYISPAEIRPVFTPAKGESLKGVNEVEIHLYDYDKIEFTGVKFELENGEAIVVPASDIKVNEGTNNDWTLTIPVPEAAKTTDGKVTVTLENLTSVDGVDHTNEIRAVYNGFTITSFEYFDAQGQLVTARTLPEFEADSKVQVVPNIGSEYPDMYMEYEVLRMVKDGEPESVKPASYMIREIDPFDGSIIFSQEFPMSVKLVRGEEYHLVFTAWTDEMSRWTGAEPLGSEYEIFTGTTEPFRFSSIQLTSVSPENYTEIEPTLTEISLDFDGLVNIDSQTSFINYGQGMTVPFARIEPIDSEDGTYANKWNLYIPETYIATYRVEVLNLTIIATDENGLLVEGNEGFEEGSYIGLEYTIAGAGTNADFYVLPAEGEVESLSEFEVGCYSQPTGINYNATETIDLVDRMNRNPIYQFTSNDMQIVSVPKEGVEIPDDADETDTKYFTTVVRFTLPTELTEDGTYLLTIPQGFFTFGDMFTTTVNAVRSVSYEINNGGGSGDEPAYTVTPAPGAVTELSEIIIEFEEGPSMGSGFPTLKIDDNEPIRLGDPDVEWPEDWSDMSNKYIQKLPQTYTEKGVYVITYPAGFFQGMFGGLPKIEITYLIDTTGIESVYGDDVIVNAYTLDGRQVIANGNADDVKALAPGMYIINGKKVGIIK